MDRIPQVGERVYVNHTDGEPRLGTVVETSRNDRGYAPFIRVRMDECANGGGHPFMTPDWILPVLRSRPCEHHSYYAQDLHEVEPAEAAPSPPRQ